jgi:3D (Asp-Asp-Asp) domain-containing protein
MRVGYPGSMGLRNAGLILIGLLATDAARAVEAKPRRNAVFNVQVTAYCDIGETASGAYTRRGIVAADPNVLPLGTQVQVRGLGRKFDGVYDVEDTGREVKGRELDIFMRDCGQAKVFGRKTARIKVLRVGTGERVSQRER